MKHLYLAALLASMTALSLALAPDASADTCETRVSTDVPEFGANKPNPIICDTHGQQRILLMRPDGTPLYGNAGVTGTAPASGTATAAAPTIGEGVVTGFSFDLAGNARVTLGTCISGESACIGTSPSSYIMTVPGVALMTTFSSVTSATTSAVTAVPSGTKTFVAQIINATSETKAATLDIYGNLISSTTGGIKLCTITLPSTATTLQLQDSCPQTSVNFLFYYYTATAYTSASSAPLTVYATK